jgi:hypothetical protein
MPGEKSGCAALLARLFGIAPKATEPVIEQEEQTLPFRLRDDFLSPAELNFYRVLRQAVGHSAIILIKVALGDLFYPKTGSHSQNQAYRNKIDRKHIDFLLCDPQSMRPLVGIELDDSSHQQADRQQRDRFVERVFAATNLPLLRQPVRSAYNMHTLMANLQELTGLDFEPAPQPPESVPTTSFQATDSEAKDQELAGAVPALSLSTGEVPLCPKCRQPMVLRTVKQPGPHYGNQFWGCPDYPRCRGVREFK